MDEVQRPPLVVHSAVSEVKSIGQLGGNIGRESRRQLALERHRHLQESEEKASAEVLQMEIGVLVCVEDSAKYLGHAGMARAHGAPHLVDTPLYCIKCVGQIEGLEFHQPWLRLQRGIG